MTPTEDSTQKRFEAENLIRQFAPAGLQEQLIALIRPAIALTATPIDDAKIPIGASKFGGSPDVPEGFEWPTWNDKPLGFLVQINLKEVTPFDVENLLPKSGILWFFTSLDENNLVVGQPEQFGGWRVLFGHEPFHRVATPTNSHWITPILTQQVKFGAGWSLPADSFDSFESSDWDDEEWEQWEDFQMQVSEIFPHRMLATPYAPQLSPLVIAANGSQGKSGYDLYDDTVSTGEWELLLQLDTGKDEFFVGPNDLGWHYFMVNREDLKKADFSRVWFNEQGT
ncbi:DUF1963 domain-containing protein [bacterium]|nr:MAG: DUF1963 domain-containing protein [bacterium]